MTTNTDQQVAQNETPEQIADDLPYRIVEAMGLGLTFRSCTCGQLPCARLRPLRDALEAAKRNERERCAQIAESVFEPAHTYTSENATEYAIFDNGQRRAISNIARAIREGR